MELIEVKTSTTEQAVEEISFREAILPPSIRELRQKLGQKAKQQKRFRFYSLYGLVCRRDVVEAAWAAVRRNDGAPGVDGVSIEQITAKPESEAAFLEDIQRSLQERTYRAQAVRRVYISKPNGKLRPLGIPTVRDRVVQAAVLLILEPIFEADFEDCSHGFRPGRSAHDALRVIQQHLKEGQTAVYDADLAGYFDSIPQDKLIACVRMRIVDGSVLGLIRQWLKAPVVEPSREGKPPTVRRNDRGTPQGGVLSPLLANIYLHWFDHLFQRADGPAQWAKAKLVRYADDFVVLARYVSPQLRGWIEGKLEGWLGLHINREKTRVLNLQQIGRASCRERVSMLGVDEQLDKRSKLLEEFMSFLCSYICFFFSSRRRHTRFSRDWSSDVCSSDLPRQSWFAMRTILSYWPAMSAHNCGDGSKANWKDGWGCISTAKRLAC